MSVPADHLVDLVDEQGNTVGVVTRQQMRQQRLLHRCVYLLVFDHAGRILIHQRTMTKDVYPGYWDVTAGGVLDAGESFDEAARREGSEELGVPLEPETLFAFRYEDERTRVIGQVYRVLHDGPFCFQPEEVVTGKFIDWAELDRLREQQPFCPDGLAVLEQYLRHW